MCGCGHTALASNQLHAHFFLWEACYGPFATYVAGKPHGLGRCHP